MQTFGYFILCILCILCGLNNSSTSQSRRFLKISCLFFNCINFYFGCGKCQNVKAKTAKSRKDLISNLVKNSYCVKHETSSTMDSPCVFI